MNENTIRYTLDRIKNATDRMRTKTGTIGQPIENVATTVENIDDANNYFNPTSKDRSTIRLYTNIIGGWKNLIKKIPKVSNKLTSYESYFSTLFYEVDLSELDTSIATNMHYMFRDCQLTSLDLSNFNTSNVTDMYGMFYSCKSLTSLDLSNFNTSNVTNMVSMFYNCTSLTSLNLSNFNISNVTSIGNLFYNCTSLSKIDFRNADFSNVNMDATMFYQVPTDCLIIVKDNTQKALLNSKFSNLTNVKTVAEYESNQGGNL